MRKKFYSITFVLFVLLCFSGISYLLAEDVSDVSSAEKDIAAKKAIQEQTQVKSQAEQKPVNIPKVTVEYKDEKTGKYPSEMTIDELIDYKKRQQEEADKTKKEMEAAAKIAAGDKTKTDKKQQPQTNASKVVVSEYKSEVTDFVSLEKAADSDNIILNLKTESGETIKFTTSPNTKITKVIPVSGLKAGEKLVVDYIKMEKENRLISIKAGDVSPTRMTIPDEIKQHIPNEQLKEIEKNTK